MVGGGGGGGGGVCVCVCGGGGGGGGGGGAYYGVGNQVILDENVPHPFVSNCGMVGAVGHIHHSMAIHVPGLPHKILINNALSQKEIFEYVSLFLEEIFFYLLRIIALK